ncbi:hypothetical protein JIN85_19075 [Luteolibacter pohnpeiensis]|uniref:Uncharacterized protein n=1 Tax=Luteolibacter pohnpeiensis TaxID=454153 RepID=A0A934VWE2_9BACT|nr:hypothetical protein [Luteolibacter pohnpeiensis]MBK1884527.1 hypothetical protein [Luteolibacter pohnpeiensis]
MKSSQTKWGDPAAFLLLFVPLWIAFRGIMDIRSFLGQTNHGVWDYLNLVFTAVVLVVVAGFVGRRLVIRWEILIDGAEITLTRNRAEVFRGDANDLKVRGYGSGMLQFEAPGGGVFAFPAFGVLERFTRTGETEQAQQVSGGNGGQRL